jgi:putative ABC transport system permease protein
MLDVDARVRSALAGSAVDSDVIDELALHAETTYDALRADGTSEPDAIARIDALIDGWRRDPLALRRVTRVAAVIPPVESRSMFSGAWADALYGLRLLRAKPGYAAVTILTIALGVGAVTTLFSVAYGVLLRPLPWGNTERLVRLSETRGGREGRVPGTMMNGSYLAWADAPQTLDAIGYYSGDNAATLTGAGEATRIMAARTTPSTIQLLGVAPVRGRIFDATDGVTRTTEPSMVLVSYNLWEERLGLRDDIVGQPIVLDGMQHTIVGVMPREFRFPSAETRAWIAWKVPPVDNPGGTKTGTIMRAVGKLKPGVTVAQASAEGTARAIAAPDAGPVAMALFGARDPIQITVRDAGEAAAADVRPAILILLIASALLFLTAIANVANMQLARATARHREMTIRAALGAAAGRLARQLLIENAIVGVLGSLAGLALTMALHAALPSMLPEGFPRIDAIEIDGRVLAFTLLLSIVATIACGVLPLFYLRKLEIARSLGDSSAGSAGAGRSRVAGVRALIVASQVAVTCVLVIGGVLLARSFAAQISADRGFETTNLLTGSIPFPSGYPIERKEQTLTHILDRLQQRPGITRAAISSGLPLASAGGFSGFTFPSPFRNGAIVEAEVIKRVVTPGYFDAMGMRLRAGRALAESDTATSPVAIVVNRTFVTKYLENVPIEKTIGASLGTGPVRLVDRKAEASIVGVVDDQKQERPGDPPQAEMFVSFIQVTGTNAGGQYYVVARTNDDPMRYVEALRTTIQEEDPALALDAVMTMDQRVGNSLSRPRLYAVLFLGFAVFALVIAGAGLFGVLSHSVAQRSRELAVRTALGATRGAVIGTALRQMAIATLAGLAIGLASSAALANNLEPFVYGVSTLDWLSFGIAPIVLLIVVAIACVMPARRVAQTDPVQVLRET